MGGEGAADVARAVVKVVDSGKSKLKLLYPDDMPLLEKIRTIAKEIYRARDISADKSVRDQLEAFEKMGYGKAPVCIAKTQYSFTTNGDVQGRAERPHGQCARGAAFGRRRVRGGDLRRDHDHARPAARAGRRLHRRRAGRAHRRDCSRRASVDSKRSLRTIILGVLLSRSAACPELADPAGDHGGPVRRRRSDGHGRSHPGAAVGRTSRPAGGHRERRRSGRHDRLRPRREGGARRLSIRARQCRHPCGEPDALQKIRSTTR